MATKKKAAKKSAPKTTVSKSRGGPFWEYYKVDFLLRTEMLGTCPEASIMEEHVIEKAKKQITKANRLEKRLKALDKFKGSEIPEEKEREELKGIIRNYVELTGKPTEHLPDDKKELLLIAEELKTDFEELVKKGEEVKATVFMRAEKQSLGLPLEAGDDENATWPIISTHQILGNFKENANIIINGFNKESKSKFLPDQLTTKVSVGEQFAMSVKPVEQFMIPSNDIVRNPDGSRKIVERIVRWKDNFGNTVTAINTSEMLPIGTEFGCVLRVRRNGPIDEEFIRELLEYGKNNGLGCWRGSGNKGSFFWRLEKLENYREDIPAGWN